MGKNLSRIISDLENQILQIMINYFVIKRVNIFIIVEPEPDTLLQVSIRHCIMLTYNSLENIK